MEIESPIIQLVNNVKPFQGDIRTFDWHQHTLDMDGDEYYKDARYMNHSLISGGYKNPEKLQLILAGWKDPSKDTAATQFGRAFHLGLLQPELYNAKYYVMDDLPVCEQLSPGWQKNGKKPRSTKLYKEWKASVEAECERDGKSIIHIDEHTIIQDMVSRVYEVPQIREFLDNTLKEQIISGEYDGIPFKGMVDVTDGAEFELDLKTIWGGASLQPVDLMQTIDEYNYDSQQWVYGDMMNIKERFILFVHKTYPYTPVLVRLSPDTLDRGKVKFQNMLDNFKRNIDIRTNTLIRKPFYIDYTI